MIVKNKITKTKSIYLAGPIAGCTEEDMHGWRERIKNHPTLLSSSMKYPTTPRFGLVEPTYTPLFHYLDPTDRVYKEEGPMSLETTRKIVLGDKNDITSGDIVLANLSMLDKYSCVGSIMEVIYAYEHGKYVLVIVDPNKPVSPWIIYHATTLVHSEQEAVDTLRRIV